MKKHPIKQYTHPIHICRNQGDWMECTACKGRIHLPGCTTRRNPKRDCCLERHTLLYNQGSKKGLDDSSVDMLPYDLKLK